MKEKKMRVLSIINLKGGVAKTITSTVFACILSTHCGYKVLLVDNDKQGDASRKACKIDKQNKMKEMEEKRPTAAAARQMIHKAYQSYGNAE